MMYLYLLPILALYVLFDVHYFLRVILTIYLGRLFQKKKKILDESTIYGICLTHDVDINLGYMNSARYQRELDFARYLYSDRSGLYLAIMERGATVVGACMTRHCRKIPVFMPYKIVTNMIYWEDKSVYVEQKFITLPDNIVRAVSITKHAIIGRDINMHEIIGELDPTARLPDLPERLELWIKSLEETSQKYRKTN